MVGNVAWGTVHGPPVLFLQVDPFMRKYLGLAGRRRPQRCEENEFCRCAVERMCSGCIDAVLKALISDPYILNNHLPPEAAYVTNVQRPSQSGPCFRSIYDSSSTIARTFVLLNSLTSQISHSVTRALG